MLTHHDGAYLEDNRLLKLVPFLGIDTKHVDLQVIALSYHCDVFIINFQTYLYLVTIAIFVLSHDKCGLDTIDTWFSLIL